MKRKSIYITLIFLPLIFLCKCALQDDTYVIKGSYMGQKPPGNIPVIFARGIVSTGLDELNSVFSPDGREFYFCVRNYSSAVSIFQMRMENEIWSAPELLPFASRFGDIDVTISSDGQKILFSSRRPAPGSQEPKTDNDFWIVERDGYTWGNPIYLGDDINSESHDYYPMMTKNGTIYFSSQREGPGTNNIYKSEFVNGKYLKPIKLAVSINTENREFDPYISPDESILIFTSDRPEGFGSGDLYISFKDKEGNWMKAKNMGNNINTRWPEYSPMISPDGKYIFFTSARRSEKKAMDKPFNYEDFKKYQKSSENGWRK